MAKKHNIKLVVGDWSFDGHNQIDTYIVKSNLTMARVEEAYKKGVKKVGLDLTKDVASDYEDNNISIEQYEKLVELGFEGTPDVEVADDGEVYTLCGTEGFRDMYLFIVKMGDKSFEYEVVKSDAEINIGGYGLFG